MLLLLQNETTEARALLREVKSIRDRQLVEGALVGDV